LVGAAAASRRGMPLTYMTPQDTRRIRELDFEARRYREAAIHAVQQLEWCAKYFYRLRKVELAERLARNRAAIIERARLFE
jgi:predicted ATPase